MKILAILGSPRRGTTLNILKSIEKCMIDQGVVQFEYVYLNQLEILPCRGCCRCYDKSERECPLQDDVNLIVEQMKNADGVIFASPTYVMNVSGLMKNFIDRLSYLCHRSPFYEKEAMLVATCAGQIGVKQTLKSLSWPVMAWGFHLASQLGIVTGHYKIHQLYERDQTKLERQTQKFTNAIIHQKYKKPSFSSLVGFRYRQLAYKKAEQSGKITEDIRYWIENGWLDLERRYFIEIKKNLLQESLVKLVTWVMMRMA